MSVRMVPAISPVALGACRYADIKIRVNLSNAFVDVIVDAQFS